MLDTAEMPRKQNFQITVRIESDLADKLDQVAQRIARPGLPVTRTDAIRVALATGIEAILAEPERPATKPTK